jgi:hypothetical protein
MIEFFKEGGWGMWPILVLSLVTVGASARFAAKPQRRQIGFLFAMGLATVMSIFHATWTDIGSVLNFISSEEAVKEPELMRIFVMGLKESTRPGALGGAFLTLAAILGAVGMLRIDREEE